MDTKRMILAIALSIIVIVAYQYFFVKPVPPKPIAAQQQPGGQGTPGQVQSPAGATGNEALPPSGATGQSQAAPVDLESLFTEKKAEEAAAVSEKPVEGDIRAAAEQVVTVETPDFTARFSNRGAALKSLVLRRYKDDKKQPMELVSDKAVKFGIYPFHFWFQGQDAIFKQLNESLFACESAPQLQVQANGLTTLTFRYADKAANLSAEKKFVISGGTYRIGLEISVIKDGVRRDAPVVFGPGLERSTSAVGATGGGLRLMWFNGDKSEGKEFTREKTAKTANPAIETANGTVSGVTYWVSYHTTYFAAVFKTDPRRSKITYSVIRELLPENKSEGYYYLVVTNPAAVFLGPKDERILKTQDAEFPSISEVIEYGWFGSIARLMLRGIAAIHDVIPNYGWAIILFTLFLKILLFPLTYSSSKSMAKMQALQPKMKAIRKKYKNQRDVEQRRLMNAEIMALYKQEKVNPAGGCLPLLLQLPILWGFFRMLSVSINVRHEPWMLWITDLSKKDPFYVLPILMGLTQIVLQKMTPSGGDDTQRKIMYIMPVFMTILFLSFPSGLNLYWFFSNVLQIGQQKLINERIGQQKKEEEHEQRILKRKKGAKNI